jgi:hypothetical protein
MNPQPCKKYEASLAAKVFGDLNTAEEQKLQNHLDACNNCRDFLTEMEIALGKLGAPQRPEMPEHFWEGYWHRLAQRLEKEEHAAPQQESVFVRWREGLREKWLAQPLLIPLARTAGILALLVFGVIIGHYWWPRNSGEMSPITRTVPAAIPVAQARAEQWLERSKILLIGVANEDLSAAKPDFSHQRQVSRKLLTEAQSLNRELDPIVNRQLIQLMSQLELILLQIANLDAEHDLSSVELVRDGIARDGLLLKINIAELAQQAQQQHLAPKKPSRKSSDIL